MSLVETLHEERKARLARFAWAAQHPKIKNRTVTRDVPVKPYAELVVVPFDEAAWIERQRQIPIVHKEPWFEIVEGPQEFLRERTTPKIEDIQRVVCRHYLLDWRDMLSHRRTKDVIKPRHVAMYLCKQLTIRSLPEIGRRFGDRDHSSVLSAVRKIARQIGADLALAAEVEDLRKKCEAA